VATAALNKLRDAPVKDLAWLLHTLTRPSVLPSLDQAIQSALLQAAAEQLTAQLGAGAAGAGTQGVRVTGPQLDRPWALLGRPSARALPAPPNAFVPGIDNGNEGGSSSNPRQEAAAMSQVVMRILGAYAAAGMHHVMLSDACVRGVLRCSGGPCLAPWC
jgi:hypothetical protein